MEVTSDMGHGHKMQLPLQMYNLLAMSSIPIVPFIQLRCIYTSGKPLGHIIQVYTLIIEQLTMILGISIFLQGHLFQLSMLTNNFYFLQQHISVSINSATINCIFCDGVLMYIRKGSWRFISLHNTFMAPWQHQLGRIKLLELPRTVAVMTMI